MRLFTFALPWRSGYGPRSAMPRLLALLTPTAMPYPRLAVPPQPPVYTGLHTDYYPWAEVTVDLATRQAQGLSAVFDMEQGGQWARFVWVRGALQGGFTAQNEVMWPAAMAALPRAQVTLTALDPVVAELIWASRTVPLQALDGVWPTHEAALVHHRFSGVILCDGAVSYWAGGQVVGGQLPPEGAACLALPLLSDAGITPPAPAAATPAPAARPATLLPFWTELIAATHRVSPLDEAWRLVSVRLAEQYPCLDPFAHEVYVEGGELHVEAEVAPGELRSALLGAYQAALARLGLRLADLPVAELRTRPEWAAAGLEVA